MLDTKCVLFLLSCSYILGANAGAVTFIDPCPWENKQCILESSIKAMPYIVKGITELKIDSVDPLKMDFVNADTGDLKMNITDLTVKHLSKCTLKRVERPNKLQIIIELECPIEITGTYEALGKFLGIEVYGNDKCLIKTDNIKFLITVDLGTFEKNDEQYYKIVKFDYTFVPDKKCYLIFEELNKGADTAAVVKQILDENWKEILVDFAKPIIKAILRVCVKDVEKVISSIPINKIEKP